nr:MAG TPA: stabilization protein [Bacteriophage sp.]
MSITNEKGPKELTIRNSLGSKTAIEGTILGYCVLNDYLVLFIHNGGNSDSILRIDMSYDEPELVVLFKGNLGFNLDYPIDTVSDYENENI